MGRSHPPWILEWRMGPSHRWYTPTQSFWFCKQRCHCRSLHFFSPLASIVRVPLLLHIQKGQMQFALPWVEGNCKHRLPEVLRTYGSKNLKYYVKTCADFCSVIRGHRSKHNFSSAIFSFFFTGMFLLKNQSRSLCSVKPDAKAHSLVFTLHFDVFFPSAGDLCIQVTTWNVWAPMVWYTWGKRLCIICQWSLKVMSWKQHSLDHYYCTFVVLLSKCFVEHYYSLHSQIWFVQWTTN
jgi:hypothetical protein